MTIQTRQVAGARRSDLDWALRWFADHGFGCLPVERYGPANLSLSVSAEFEAWCETEGISLRTQWDARRVADQQLQDAAPAPSGPLRQAARDVAAWSILRARSGRCP